MQQPPRGGGFNAQKTSTKKAQPGNLSKGQRKRARAAALKASQAADQPLPTSSNRQPFAQPSSYRPTQQDQLRSHQIFRPQQTYPNAFLDIPVAVLARIVAFLPPVDVIDLAQTTTKLRKSLMSPSAGHIWRASIQNVEGLPPCPPEICEPLYVSLVFLPFCSRCGESEVQHMDTYLLVRLCLSCREHILVRWTNIRPSDVQPLVLHSQGSNTFRETGGGGGQEWSLEKEVNMTAARLTQLHRSGNKDELQAWVETRKADLSRRLEYGKILSEFITTWHRKERAELKRQWREGVEQKLLELGCTEKEQDFPRPMRSQWRSFFNEATIFTTSSWDRLKPKIIRFLEERVEWERRQRRSDRDRKLESLFSSIKSELDVSFKNYRPEGLDGGGGSSSPSSLEPSIEESITMISNSVPLPEFIDALEWPIIENLLETDASAEEMADNFEKLRDEIKQLLFDWGARVKHQYARLAREGRQEEGLPQYPPRPKLRSAEAGNNLFQTISLDDCLLFRADTIFRLKSETFTYDTIHIYLCGGGGVDYVRRPSDYFKLEAYAWDPKASAIARALLTDMGCPDASSAEFNGREEQLFSCGRCHIHPSSWSKMILHYAQGRDACERAQKELAKVAQSKITFRYVHDINTPGGKPFITRTTAEDREAYEALLGEDYESKLGKFRLKCKLCEQVGLKPSTFDEPDILAHMVNVHEVSDTLSGASIDDEGALKANPYIRRCTHMEDMLWGWGQTVYY